MAKPKRDPHWSDEVGQLDQDVETLKAMGRSLRDVVRGGISQMRAERRDARDGGPASTDGDTRC